MNVAVLIGVVGAAASALLAIVWYRLSAAPGWRSQRSVAAIAATCAVYCAADLVLVLDCTDAVLRAGVQLSTCAGALHGAAWIRAIAEQQHRVVSRVERWLLRSGYGLAALMLVPGAITTTRVHEVRVAVIGVTYRFPEMTTLGVAAYVYFAVALVAVGAATLRYRALGGARRWRGLVPSATCIGLGALAVNDTLVSAGLMRAPLLIDAGFFGATVVFGVMQLERFGGDARRLELLSTELGSLVEARSHELTASLRALSAAERWAAVGRMSGHVAHEVNSPLSIIQNNLDYLGDAAAVGDDSEARQALAEARAAVQQIVTIVRSLRGAASSDELRVAAYSVRPIVERAVEHVRASVRANASTVVSLQGDLARPALAAPLLLERGLVEILTSAFAAARSDGAPARVELEVRGGERVVEIEVRHNGASSAPPAAMAGADDLSIASGLVEVQGGELAVRAPPHEADPWTRFVVRLPTPVGA